MASSILARLAVLISGDTAGLNKSLGTSTKALTTFQKSANSVSASLAGIAAGVSFVAIGKEIISITAEFQKFEAVLTNTLGSQSEAQEALRQIQDFAAKTPFSVQELTNSFVKLANQGFKPSTDEMRKLGDLASSTGKSFDQLAEAIIDAQAGEFERLKEFGIRAAKSGDQVKFTFKGVETQTKNTSASIQEYLLSLGELEGVSGAMSAISGTLGGSISNLGDSFDKLLLRIGSLTSGPLKFFIDQAQLAINTLAGDIAGDTGATTRLSKIIEGFVDGAKTAEEITANIEKLNRLIETEQKNYDKAAKSIGQNTEEMIRLGEEQTAAKEFVDGYGTAVGLLTKKLDELKKATTAVTTPTLSIIQQINADIKHFEELKNKSFSIEQIGRFNQKLQELRDELELINATGSESGFLKNLEAGLPTGAIPTQPTEEGLGGAFPTTLDINIQPYKDKLEEAATAQNAFGLNEEELVAQSIARQDALIAKQIEAADAASLYGQAIGDSLGQAVAGQITFAQAMKKITADLVKMFLARAMAGIISSAATAGGPPPVAIALAAAGVAAIGALFSKFVGVSGGGGSAGGVGGRATQNVNRIGVSDRPEDRIVGNVKFEIEGNKLIGVLNNTSAKKQRTG